MKRVLLLVGLLFAIIEMSAASTIKFVDAATLTIAGKLSKTTNPYHRAEVSEYPSLKEGRSRTGKPLEGTLLRMSTGVMVIFETDSPEIWVKPEYGFTYPFYSMPMAATHGFNLYIEKDGKLRWAASRGRTIDAQGEGKAKAEKPLRLIANIIDYSALLKDVRTKHNQAQDGTLAEQGVQIEILSHNFDI